MGERPGLPWIRGQKEYSEKINDTTMAAPKERPDLPWIRTQKDESTMLEGPKEHTDLPWIRAYGGGRYSSGGRMVEEDMVEEGMVEEDMEVEDMEEEDMEEEDIMAVMEEDMAVREFSIVSYNIYKKYVYIFYYFDEI